MDVSQTVSVTGLNCLVDVTRGFIRLWALWSLARCNCSWWRLPFHTPITCTNTHVLAYYISFGPQSVCATPRRRVHRLNILYLIGRQNRGCIIKTFPSLFPISSTTLSHPPLCCVSFCLSLFSKQHIVFDQPCIVNAAHLISALWFVRLVAKCEGQRNYSGIITAPFHHFISFLHYRPQVSQFNLLFQLHLDRPMTDAWKIWSY